MSKRFHALSLWAKGQVLIAKTKSTIDQGAEIGTSTALLCCPASSSGSRLFCCSAGFLFGLCHLRLTEYFMNI